MRLLATASSADVNFHEYRVKFDLRKQINHILERMFLNYHL